MKMQIMTIANPGFNKHLYKGPSIVPEVGMEVDVLVKSGEWKRGLITETRPCDRVTEIDEEPYKGIECCGAECPTSGYYVIVDSRPNNKCYGYSKGSGIRPLGVQLEFPF